MLKSLCLLALLGAAAAFPSPAEEEHSVVKRQTTLSGNISRLFDGSPLSWETIIVAVIILLAIDVIGTLVFAAAFSGRSSDESTFGFTGIGEYIGNFYNSLDMTEFALKTLNVRHEACKYKAVCVAERAAKKNPIASLAINTLNSRLSGLGKYASAVEAGLRGEDCELIYDQCNETSLFF